MLASSRSFSRRSTLRGGVRCLSSSPDLVKLLQRQEDMLTQLFLKVEKLEKQASGQPSAVEEKVKDAEKKVPSGKDPRGFINYHRVAEPYRPPRERSRDWLEINSVHGDVKEQKRQAARCMDCGTPFCQTHTGCPIHNLIPEWNELVLNDQWLEAIDRLHKTNNFPEFTGRVCPAPCEGACVAGLVDDPVTIKNMEYAIIDRAFKEGWVTPRYVRKEDRTGKSIAVIGSGPAGLAAADQLNQLGHSVSVFEREDQIGGLLYYGIPNMKLDKRTVDRRVNLLREEGIEFLVNQHVGVNVDAQKMLDKFDAVVLAVGATKPRLLSCPGADLKGVYPAMTFLTSNQKDLAVDEKGNIKNTWGDQLISAEGKNVVVIGGGDTGTDCIGTSLRQYAKSVVNLELLPERPPKRNVFSKDNPWPLFPRTSKMDYGHEECAAIFGEDPRKYAINTKKVIGDAEGNVRAIQIVKLEWKGNKFEEIPGSEEEIPADLVLCAMGFVSPEETLLEAFQLKADERGNVAAPYGQYNTSRPGVFAAGDCRRGQSLVVWAINEGRGVADAVDAYLSKK